MPCNRSGWKNESYRHGLSSKGIKTVASGLVQLEGKAVEVENWKPDIHQEGYSQLCVWPGTVIKKNEYPDFEKFMKEMGAKHKPLIVGTVLTQPDIEDGRLVEGTGGRADLFFYVHDDDLGNIAVPRLQVGIRWWEDIFGNNQQDIYPEDFRKAYPRRW